MRFLLAVLVGRLIRFIGKFSGRATNLPGSIALKLCPGFLGRIRFDGKVIAVTGSNGKTTTTNLIAHTLRQAGHTVAINEEGSNLTPGVVTTLLLHCTLGGRMTQDFVVLEVDERYSPIIFASMTPDIFVVNNLFRDQVVRNGNPDIIFEKINSAIAPGVQLVLNGNDPISQRLAPENPRVYFGMDRTDRSSDSSHFLTHDCKVCPQCFHRLTYHYYHYNHIGNFRCDFCGYKTPQLDFMAKNVDFAAGRFEINGMPAAVTYKTTFHVINTTAAVAACVQAGLPIERAIAGAATFSVSKVRYDEMNIEGRKGVLMLTKQNSASLDQSISFALEQPEEKTVVLHVNNVIYSDNKDISWLYDVTFERLRGRVNKVVCTGNRAFDIAVRLRLGGFAPDDYIVVEDLGKTKEAIRQTEGSVYILAASAFGDEDGILEALQ